MTSQEAGAAEAKGGTEKAKLDPAVGGGSRSAAVTGRKGAARVREVALDLRSLGPVSGTSCWPLRPSRLEAS